MLKRIQDRCKDFKVKKLTVDDTDEIYELYKTNPDYFEIVEARNPKIEDCRNDLTECPSTISYDKKCFIGFYQNEKLFAVVDFLMGYPNSDVFYIGLFMLEGKSRAKGYGRKLLKEIIEVAVLEGFTKLRLGVVSGNVNAVNFWEKNGLKEIKRVMRARENGTEVEVIVMEKELRLE